MRKILLISVAALILTGCIQQPKAEKQLTPQEQIIENIVRTSFPDKVWKVQLDESANMQQALQQAIDSCSYYGGGVVDVAPGMYALNGPLKLKSNVNLHLQEGAYLQFSGRSKDFLPVVLTRWEGTELYGHSPMIYAYHATNIAITGKGTIDAQAGLEFATWGPKEANDRDRLREMGDKLTPVQERIFGEGTILRPSFVQFYGCSRILVEDVTFKDSPFWTIHPVFCDNVIVRGVTIDSHFPNNDGCDPESCENVLIEDCVFNTGDDCIAIKSGRNNDGRAWSLPSRNIIVRNCQMKDGHAGVAIGSEISGSCYNVWMEDCQIGSPEMDRPFRIKSNAIRGGVVSGFYIRNIDISECKQAVLKLELKYEKVTTGLYYPLFENILLENITCQKSRYGIWIDGLEDHICVKNVTLNNCHFNGITDEKVNSIVGAEGVTFTNSTFNGQTL